MSSTMNGGPKHDAMTETLRAAAAAVVNDSPSTTARSTPNAAARTARAAALAAEATAKRAGRWLFTFNGWSGTDGLYDDYVLA